MIKITSILVILMFASCSPKEVELGSDYVLVRQVDSECNWIAFKYGSVYIGTVPCDVIAFGFDRNFIIAKQRNFSSQCDFPVNYFIIPKNNPVSNSKDLNRIGPLNRVQFDSIVHKYDIRIDFINR